MWIQACLCWLKVWKKSLPSDAFVTAKPWCRCNNSNKGCFLFLFRDLVLLSKPKSSCQHALSTLGGLMIVQQNLSSIDKVKAFFRMCKGGKWDCNLTKPNCHFTMANHYNCKKDKLSFYYDQQDHSINRIKVSSSENNKDPRSAVKSEISVHTELPLERRNPRVILGILGITQPE